LLMDDQRGFHEQPQPKYHAGYGSRGRSPACLMRSKMESNSVSLTWKA
jgi:hypothetical protein